MTSLRNALLKEETSVLNVALDLAGLIPGLGEFADAANALDYAKKGDYIMCALSIISMIPEIGDVVGKGGKISLWVGKTFPKSFSVAQKYGPDVANAIKTLRDVVKKNKPLIDKILLALKQDPKFEELKSHLPKIQDAINMFMKDESEEEIQKRVDPTLAKSPENKDAMMAMKEWVETRRMMSIAGL
jgi:hypothetical protein